MRTTLPLPAPWHLSGNGAAILLRQACGKIGLCIFANYERSDAGAYHELLWIGDLWPKNGQKPSIETIYVSTQLSVDQGQKNWGIPKQRADFVHTAHADAITVRMQQDNGQLMAGLTVAAKNGARRWPVNTVWLPAAALTLQQHWQGQKFVYAPKATGHVRRATVIDWQFDAQFFPDLRQYKVLAAFLVDDFQMVFPLAQVSALAEL